MGGTGKSSGQTSYTTSYDNGDMGFVTGANTLNQMYGIKPPELQQYDKFIKDNKLDGKPTVLNGQAFYNAAAQSEYTITYRGFVASDQQTLDSYVDQFKYGDDWYLNGGAAWFGFGMYVGNVVKKDDPNAVHVNQNAKDYADIFGSPINNPNHRIIKKVGTVVEMTFKKGAKIGDLNDYLKTVRPARTIDMLNKYDNVRIINWAKKNGYSAYRVTGSKSDADQLVVLDRGSLIIKGD